MKLCNRQRVFVSSCLLHVQYGTLEKTSQNGELTEMCRTAQPWGGPFKKHV